MLYNPIYMKYPEQAKHQKKKGGLVVAKGLVGRVRSDW